MSRNDPKGYYAELNVSTDATEKEIKKGYRKLAPKWHPDRAPSEEKEAYTEKFKKINEAYEVLKDPNKRREYDTGGPSGFTGFDDDFNPFSVFESFFSGRDPFAGFNDDFFGDSLFGPSPFSRGRGNRSSGRSSQRRGAPFGMMMSDPFGDSFGFGSSFSSFSSSSRGGRGMGVSSSVQTQIVNGRKRTVKTTRDANGETKEVYENDQLVEKIENGQITYSQQEAISYEPAPQYEEPRSRRSQRSSRRSYRR